MLQNRVMNFEIFGIFSNYFESVMSLIFDHLFSLYHSKSYLKSDHHLVHLKGRKSLGLATLLVLCFLSFVLANSTVERAECYTCGEKVQIRGRVLNGEEVMVKLHLNEEQLFLHNSLKEFSVQTLLLLKVPKDKLRFLVSIFAEFLKPKRNEFNVVIKRVRIFRILCSGSIITARWVIRFAIFRAALQFFPYCSSSNSLS